MAEHILHKLGPFDVPQIGARHVRVYIPPGDAPNGRPVLYMFDAQNLFHDEPSYAGGWHLHLLAHRFARQGRVAPAIVGVDHGGASRLDELGPWKTERGGGKTDALLDWMAGTLIPRVRGEFSLASEPGRAGIGGSSMGGLAALYAHFRHPELFGLTLSMSPSLWFAGGKIFEHVAAASKPWTSRIYLDAGALEGHGGVLRSVERMATHLRGRGWDDGSLRLLAAKRGTHSEKHWRRRAPLAVEFLFDPGAARKRAKKAA